MRLADLQKVTYPETLAEAVRILSDETRGAVPIAGGISFIFAPMTSVRELVCLSRLPLNYIHKKNGSLRIGAATPIADLVSSAAVKKYAGGALWDAARRIGSTLNRNLITVGGNLVQPFIWSDLSTIFLALGARIVIQEKKIRELPAEQFFARMPRQLLKPGELVTEIILPALARNVRCAYDKFTLTENDFALLKVAILLSRTDRRCREITIVVGGATLLPQRIRFAEEVLKGKIGSQILVNEASEIAAEEIKISKDIRCSEGYKRDLCRAQVRGILERILLDQKVPEWKLF
ncbi:MAG: FAD binding domain-containing protein [PVC group bacterium]